MTRSIRATHIYVMPPLAHAMKPPVAKWYFIGNILARLS
jgi:hypothetical protein